MAGVHRFMSWQGQTEKGQMGGSEKNLLKSVYSLVAFNTLGKYCTCEGDFGKGFQKENTEKLSTGKLGNPSQVAGAAAMWHSKEL